MAHVYTPMAVTSLPVEGASCGGRPRGLAKTRSLRRGGSCPEVSARRTWMSRKRTLGGSIINAEESKRCMKCATCGIRARVFDTRTLADGTKKRKARCPDGHITVFVGGSTDNLSIDHWERKEEDYGIGKVNQPPKKVKEKVLTSSPQRSRIASPFDQLYSFSKERNHVQDSEST